jgi:hypothetical protein
MFLLLSIHHSGTRFSSRILEPDFMLHVDAPGAEEKMQAASTIVVPMRHPFMIWSTWWKQSKTRRFVCPNCGPIVTPKNDFWDQFEVMDRWHRWRSENSTPMLFLPVDHPARDEYLRQVCERIKKDVSTDWRAWDDEKTQPGNIRNKGPTPKIELSRLFEYSFVSELYEPLCQ